MSPATFERVLDELAPYVFLIFLHHTGEPFLNPELPKFFSLARSRRVATVVSSNFSLPLSDSAIEAIVAGGLSYLTVSLDGITQETYAKYRVGGKLETVLNNARRVIETKRRLGSATPTVAWQFINFDHNRHEMAQAQRMAREIGFDQFVVMRPNEQLCRDEKRVIGTVKEPDAADPRFPFKCRWLWALPIVLYDGGVVPCCHYDWNRRRPLGSIVAQPFMDIWSGNEFRQNRRLVANKAARGDCPDAHCNTCPLKVPDF
jgi:MoaA/NifB/PqqE/SkfB family radical SAM enzyme